MSNLELAVDAATLATVAGVVVAVLTWWTQIRKVPEVAFRWVMPGVFDGVWDAEDLEPVPLKPNTDYLLRVVFTNVGTGTAAPSLIVNIIVPSFVTIASRDRDGSLRRPIDASDVAVNDPPAHDVWFVAARSEEFFPAMDLVVDSYVRIDGSEVPQDREDWVYYFGAAAEAVGLTATGHRRWWSWAHRLDAEHWRREEWPGPRYKRQLRKVSTSPIKTVRCGPGKRLDRRPFRVDSGTA